MYNPMGVEHDRQLVAFCPVKTLDLLHHFHPSHETCREELVSRIRCAFGQGESTEIRIGVPVESSPNLVSYEEIYQGETHVLGKNTPSQA